MVKDLYEENKELKRVLYNIEKAIFDFRLTQLDLPLEKVNIPSLGLSQPQVQPTSYTLTTCSCNNGEGCNCEEEKEVLREQIAALTAKLNGTNAELEQYKRKEVTEEDVALTGFPCDSVADEEDEVIYENGFATYAEPAPPREEEKKTRKPRKERGGTVFTDFKNLELENNDYEGNSIIYSKKDM